MKHSRATRLIALSAAALFGLSSSACWLTAVALGQAPAHVHDRSHEHGVAAGESIPSPDVAIPIDTWSLDDFHALAAANNPTLAQALAHVGMARGRRVQSGLMPNPIVGYSADEIGDEGRAGQQGGFIEQEIPTAGKLRLNRQTFAQEEAQERWALQMQGLIVQNSVEVAFYETLAVQHLLAVRQQLARIASDGVTVTQQLANIGQADRPDLLAIQIENRKANIAVVEARNRHRRMWTHLTALVGQPALELRPLGGSLEPLDDKLDPAAAWTFVEQNSPELQIACAGVRRARAALARAEVEPIPNVYAAASAQYDNASRDAIAGVQLGLNIPVFDRNQGNILSAQAALQHAIREVDRVALSLRSRFGDAWERYDTARTIVEQYQREILPQAREAYELYTQAFQRRAAAFPQVLIAQQSYFEAEAEYVAALSDYKRAEVELNGLLLVDGLTQPEPHGMTAPEPPGMPVRSVR